MGDFGGPKDFGFRQSENRDIVNGKSQKGLDVHFSRVEKSVIINQGGHGLLSTKKKDIGESKMILKNVSGEAKAGEILAIMGPSGSGKTTLLDVLAGRGPFQAGSVTINKIPYSKDMKRSIGYVMQSDLFFDHLTVKDTLTYTALLRLPGNWTNERKMNLVDQVIKQLRLQKCATTTISLISGGEKKRTNIGTELLTNPQILMLDEPTSGLDSTTAVALMKTLQAQAAEGRTVVTSIHQPSSGVFASFNRLLLLADGCVVYDGTPSGSMEYFAALHFPCPEGYNAADHCMDLLVIDSNLDSKGGGVSTRNQLIQAWDSEAGAVAVEASRSKLNGQKASLNEMDRKYGTSYMNQIMVLTHRSLQNKRSALFTKINLLKSVGLGFISGFCWFQMKDTESYVRDRTGFMFFATIYWIFDAMFESMMAFPAERMIMEKERNSGSYHLSAYFLAKTFSEAPCRLLMPSIYIFISYFMTNMRLGAGPFFGFATAVLLGVLSGESYGLLIGASIMDFENALVSLLLVSLGLMLGGGYYVENIPAFYSWVEYISPFKYAFHAALRIEFQGRKTKCDGSGIVPDCYDNTGGYVSGEDVINYYQAQGSIGFNLGFQFLLFVVVRFIAYLSLRLHKSSVRG